MKKNLNLIIASILFTAFIIFTVIVKTVDVSFIVTNGTYIGLSSFNYLVGNWVMSLNKMNDMKIISDILLYIVLGFSLIFFIVGIIQWIKGKSLKTVDKNIYLLAIFYVLIAIIFLVFEIVRVNYSPISDKGLKASYPSTHVFVGASLLLLNSVIAIKMLNIENKLYKAIIYISAIIIALLIAFTRLLSLKHWATDIIASFILIPSVFFLFRHFYKYLNE